MSYSCTFISAARIYVLRKDMSYVFSTFKEFLHTPSQRKYVVINNTQQPKIMLKKCRLTVRSQMFFNQNQWSQLNEIEKTSILGFVQDQAPENQHSQSSPILLKKGRITLAGRFFWVISSLILVKNLGSVKCPQFSFIIFTGVHTLIPT